MQISLVLFVTFVTNILLAFVMPESWGKERLIFMEVALIIPSLVFVTVRKYPAREIFRLRGVSLPVMLSSLLIGLGMTVLADVIDRLVQKWVPMSEELISLLLEALKVESVADWVIIIAAGVIIAAIVEEMLFRGMLQTTMERVTDLNKAIMMTALVFTFIHFNPWWAIEIMMLGVLLGVMAWRSGSIVPGIIVHAVNNAISIAMVNVDESHYSWYFQGNFISPVVIGIGLVLITGGVMLFFQRTENRPGQEVS